MAGNQEEGTNQRMSKRAKIALFGTFGGLLAMIFVGLFMNGGDPSSEHDEKLRVGPDDANVRSAYEKGNKAFDQITLDKQNRDQRRRNVQALAESGGGGQKPAPRADATPDGSGNGGKPAQPHNCKYPDGSMLNQSDPGCTPIGPGLAVRAGADMQGGPAQQDPAAQARRQMLEQIRARRSQLFQEAVSSKISVSSQFAQASQGGPSGRYDASDPSSISSESGRALAEARRLSSLQQEGAAPQGGAGGFAPSGDIYPPDPNMPGASARSSAPGAQSYGQMMADGWALGNSLEAPENDYVVRAGMVIPATLISGINSDLPGQITAQVSQNVWDTATGKFLMIPQGTRLVGTYVSSVAYGQERVMMAWQRLVFPDGRTLDIGAMPGADMAGFSGANDQVNNHWFKMLGAAFLMSGITAAVSVSVDNSSSSTTNSTNMSDTMRESLATQFGTVIENVIQKNLNISPTLEIRPGYRFNVIVTKDMVFKKPYQLFNY